MARAQGPGAGRGSTAWLQGLACGALVALAPPTALLLAALLAPAVLARATDPRIGRPSVRPILLCGLATTVRPLVALWRDGHTLDGALTELADPTVLATAWAAQGAAWLVAELVPVLVRLGLDTCSFARTASLRAARAKYEAAWGIKPRDD